MRELRVAIAGYGLAGRFFHAPLIAATEGMAVADVITSNPARTRQVAAEHPEAKVLSAVADLWPTPPDLLVVATPNSSHADIAAEAIERRIPTVVDKPLAVTADEAGRLVAQAERAGVMLTVFQNRRWDTDQLTLRRLLGEGALGEVTLYESRFARWRPELDAGKWRESEPAERGGGVLLDLGSHLVDQALTLFGRASHVYAEIAARRGGTADDDAFLALRHQSGTISHLHASAVTPSPGPRLRVQGTAAAFLVPSLDPQEDALSTGARPDAVAGWGQPPGYQWGRLAAGEQSVPVPPEPGDWPRFYRLVRDAIVEGGPPPVEPRDAVEVLRVLEAARHASRQAAVVVL